jgi:UPF0755 protein
VWLGLVFLLAVVTTGASFLRWAIRPLATEGPAVVIEWPPGPGELAAHGLVDDEGAFRILLLVTSPFVTPEPGLHLLAPGHSPAEVLRRIGRLTSRQRVKVLVPEGFNAFDIARRLETLGVAEAEGFLAASRSPAVLGPLGLTGESAEGFLFPATYDMATNTLPREVLAVLVKEAKRRHGELFEAHGAELERLRARVGLDPSDVITLASIVEKEAQAADEMPLIASVFLNRLTDPTFRPPRMLQSDPTAGYGCRLQTELPSCLPYDGRHVTPAMLRDPENAYNTYRREGLPPGPIANPGIGAIRAVLAPADTEYLFFVAKGGGRHTFSRSFEDHERAIRQRREQTQGAPSAPAAEAP